MACLNGDGSLTVVAGAILVALATAEDPADVAAATGLPLYRVRGGLSCGFTCLCCFSMFVSSEDLPVAGD
jgi:hypothetical protein